MSVAQAHSSFEVIELGHLVDTGRPLDRVARVRRREHGLPGAVFDLTAEPRFASV